MNSAVASDVRSAVIKTAAAVAVAGISLLGLAAPASADEPSCPPWELTCGPDGFSMPADDGIPGDNAAEGGIPAPASVPNVDGSLSPPGMPGDI